MPGRNDYTLHSTSTSNAGKPRIRWRSPLTAWGNVKATTPCDLLPEAARRLAGSNCREKLALLQEELQQQLQQCLYGDGRMEPSANLPEQVAAGTRAFMAQLRARLKEIVEEVLREGVDGQEVTNEQLRAALTAEDPRLRWAAAVIAGLRQDSSFITELVERTEDSDFGVQVAAVWASTRTGDLKPTPVLEKWLLDKRLIGEVRRKIALALGQLGNPSSVEPLIKVLKDENRAGAAQALGQIGDPRAVGPLFEVLKGWDSYMNQTAVEALGRIGAPAVESLIGLLGDPDTWTQNRAAQALTQIGTPAAGALTKLLADIAQYPWVRNATVDVLAEIGESSIIDLVRMLNAKDEIVRRSVIQVLERIASRAVEPLTEALKDIDEDTRRTAVWVLKSMRNRRAVEPLVSVLESRDGYRQRRRNGCSTEVNRGEKEEMGQ